jgi:hypothetical protein
MSSPSSPAALSFAMLLGPDGALAALAHRAASLRKTVDAVDAELKEHSATLPRAALLETEYQRAVTAAELSWVKGVVDDLQRGTLSWRQTDFPGTDDADLSDPMAAQ